jgi:hypothetical protein
MGAVDVAQHAAGADGGELPVVADEPHGRSAGSGELDHGGQLEGAGHTCLVDDHEAPPADRLDPVGDGPTGN